MTRPPILPPNIQWAVGEDGNRVVLEFTCRDNYEAIELAEVIAAGIREGHIEFEFDGEETP